MQTTLSPIIQVADLKKIYKLENLLIFDVSNGKNAKANYNLKHLEGAIFVDLNKDLAEINIDLAIGGRHPLPQIENFAKTISNLGITTESHVIIYDDKNGANAAARFWWMLKAIGHEKVQVLNGGIQEAEKHNIPLNSKTVTTNKVALYKVLKWMLDIAIMNEVEKVATSENYLVIDVRETSRYNGEFEPIDLISGHIPGAINMPFLENLDKNGLFLSPDLLKKKYETIFKNKPTENIIFHCGSGVTACHSLLAITYAGFKTPKLYVGSWSEWSRNRKDITTNLK